MHVGTSVYTPKIRDGQDVTSGVGSPRTLRLRHLTLHSQCICGKLFLEMMQWP